MLCYTYGMKPITALDAVEAARFWKKVARGLPQDCWTWGGASRAKGYGVFWLQGAQREATHAALALAGRFPPKPGAHALHSCDNPCCVNPAHLRWGTPKENTDDAQLRQRTRGAKPGAAHHNAKLTDELVARIYALRAEGLSQRVIGAEVGVGQPAVSRVLSGARWGSIRL